MTHQRKITDTFTVRSVAELRDLLEGRTGINYYVNGDWIELDQAPYRNESDKNCILQGAIIRKDGKLYSQIDTPTETVSITSHHWIEGKRYMASATFGRVS